MSLTEHEKTQFDRLTAGLHLGDPVALKEMERREQETATGYRAFPKITVRTARIICCVLMIAIAALIPVAAHFGATGDLTLAVLTTGAIVSSFGGVLSLAERLW